MSELQSVKRNVDSLLNNLSETKQEFKLYPQNCTNPKNHVNYIVLLLVSLVFYLVPDGIMLLQEKIAEIEEENHNEAGVMVL